MHKKRRVKITFSGIDGVCQTYEVTDEIYPFAHSLSFRYIAEYVKTGEWPDAEPDCVPVVIDMGDREANVLNDARLICHDFVDRRVSQSIAKRCVMDEAAGTMFLKEATARAKIRGERDYKDLQNDKRYIRECKKKQKFDGIKAAYTGIILRYSLYTIDSFEFEDEM